MTTRYEWTKALRDERRAWAREQFENTCQRCGVEGGAMDFDHIDPRTKSFDISQNLSTGWDTFKLEVAKCQLLCRPCHITKTKEDREQGLIVWRSRTLSPSVCGTPSRYSNHKCRCDACREAWAKYMAERRAKMVQSVL